MGQEEYPLSLTEDLLLFRIDSKKIKKDQSHWKQDHNGSIPLLMINNKRIDSNMELAGIDWSKIDWEKELRGLNEEQKEKRLRQIAIIKEMQKKLNKSKNILEIIKR